MRHKNKEMIAIPQEEYDRLATKSKLLDALRDKDSTGTITIDRDHYADLVAESELLQALFAGGVGDWPGYEDAAAEVD